MLRVVVAFPRPLFQMIFSSALNRLNRPDTLPALFVTLLPPVYFTPALWGQLVLSPDDGLIFNIPLRVAAANIIRQGYLPLWNPYIFGGMPLLGAAQAGVLFPLNWFYLFFNPALATNLMMLSAYALAGLGAYLYARRNRANVPGAVATSLIWQWSGFLVGQIGHTNIVQTAALLPWLLWAMDGYGATGKRRSGIALSAIVALQAFSGHPQTLAYSLLLAAVYATVMWRSSHPKRNWYLWSLLLLASGVMLGAVQILPTYELMRNSLRASASFEFFTSFSLPPRFLLTFLAPYVVGGGDGSLFRAPYISEPFYGEFIGYVGIATLILAGLALLTERDLHTKFWTATAFVALALALGRHWPFKLYGIIYCVPVLNLFRVPARHLMELDFALAVLAGRGLTAIAAAREHEKLRRWALAVGVGVFLLTYLAVTVGRPAQFQLAREAQVSVLHAPELFMPIAIAAISALAIWMFARRQSRGTMFLVLGVLALDLVIWGQSSGWRVSSPPSDGEYWQIPETVKYLRDRERQDQRSYRILTAPHAFDPAVPPVGPSVSRSTDWALWTQPNIYMMHGIENAAGYDGFGLARYSRLAGDMKLSGELGDPNRTLRGDSREIDLLNVRYLFSMRPKSAAAAQSGLGEGALDLAYPLATRKYGDLLFAENDLGVPSLTSAKQLQFTVPAVGVDRVALLTNLSWSEDVPDGTAVGNLRLRASDGRVFDFPIRAGADTAEWAYDRTDIRRRIRHTRAKVASGYPVESEKERFEAHTYVASFAIPEKVTITGGEIAGERLAPWPDLLLNVFQVSLIDSGSSNTFPLRREWISEVRVGQQLDLSEDSGQSDDRWQRHAGTTHVDIYENTRSLPRAWLATQAFAASEQATLDIVRTGNLPDGQPWEPLRTALVESAVTLSSARDLKAARVEVTKKEPNRIGVKTSSGSPSILVLSENHYPGWRSYVDGQVVETLRVNYNQRGVLLPAGEHNVELVYRPKSVLLGLIISLLVFIALTLWCARLLPETGKAD